MDDFFLLLTILDLFIGPPEFTTTPKDQTIVKRENTKLSCAATAVPTPQIRWKLEGTYLEDAEVTQNGTLMIKNAENNQRFEGTYTCEASNSVGTKFATAQLTVHGKLVAKLEKRKQELVKQNSKVTPMQNFTKEEPCGIEFHSYSHSVWQLQNFALS